MITKPLTTAALGCVLALAGGCATAPRALDGSLAYYRDGLYLFAADEFSEALRQDPRLAAAYVDRGVAPVRLGRHAEAIEDYNRAIAVLLPPPATLAVTPPTPAASPASTEARALAMRAVSREVDGDHEGALNDLREALVVEKARRASLENLLHKLEGAR